jgi:hypothetical protein
MTFERLVLELAGVAATLPPAKIAPGFSCYNVPEFDDAIAAAVDAGLSFDDVWLAAAAALVLARLSPDVAEANCG